MSFPSQKQLLAPMPFSCVQVHLAIGICFGIFDIGWCNVSLSEVGRMNKGGFVKGGWILHRHRKNSSICARKRFPMKGFDNQGFDKRVTLSARSASEQPQRWNSIFLVWASEKYIQWECMTENSSQQCQDSFLLISPSPNTTQNYFKKSSLKMV